MTTVKLSSRRLSSELLREIEELSGQNLYACYQCGKCSAGCPLAFAADLLPHQIMRLLQFGMVKEVFASQSPWLCVACMTCVTRCPKGVDVAKVMEAIRTIQLREGRGATQVFSPPAEIVAEVPQLATVSAFRKMSL
ncbi:MAG: 4Fe-4S dicluster domain-containing protein [Armatimonadetes bacterium]|nr:4Fe-4S dicluster domain-containing protein [Armatimonadota bacterium]MDW8027746.1 4Fe-4S dicluster domain-containing protein [Armatimonadota bacterium]